MASTILPEGKYLVKTTSNGLFIYEVDKIVVDTIGDIVTLYAEQDKIAVYNWSNIEFITPQFEKTEE